MPSTAGPPVWISYSFILKRNTMDKEKKEVSFNVCNSTYNMYNLYYWDGDKRRLLEKETYLLRAEKAFHNSFGVIGLSHNISDKNWLSIPTCFMIHSYFFIPIISWFIRSETMLFKWPRMSAIHLTCHKSTPAESRIFSSQPLPVLNAEIVWAWQLPSLLQSKEKITLGYYYVQL